jgi:ketosteroid isomerase-like protein
MTVRQLIERYYQLANDGAWDAWCDLFTDDVVLDEQLAGRVTGLDQLRPMMKGFPAMYARFRNEPRHVVVDGRYAASVSHISAVTPTGERIEAEVMNYFETRDGLISYMSNVHDTVPFRPVTEG